MNKKRKNVKTNVFGCFTIVQNHDFKMCKIRKLANWEPDIGPNIHIYLLKSIFMEIIHTSRDQNCKRTHFK